MVNKPKERPIWNTTELFVTVKVKEMLRLIEADGWFLVRTRGSHRQFHHRNKTGTVTVAGKPSSDLTAEVQKSILKQAQIGTKS